MLLSLKFRKSRLTTGFLVFLFLSSMFVTLFTFAVPEVSAAPTMLTRKWTGYVAGGGEDLLIADIRDDPGMEIIKSGLLGGTISKPTLSVSNVEDDWIYQ